MKYVRLLALFALYGLLGLALVGLLFLFNTRTMAQETDTCDRITRYEDGSLVCQVIMRAEDDNITVMKEVK